jgi:hypothetical protein
VRSRSLGCDISPICGARSPPDLMARADARDQGRAGGGRLKAIRSADRSQGVKDAAPPVSLLERGAHDNAVSGVFRPHLIRVIAARLMDDAAVSWRGLDLDFTGVLFDGGDFSGAGFSGGKVNFSEAKWVTSLIRWGSAVGFVSEAG